MQSASQKIAVAVRDRRLLRSPTTSVFAYWRTYLAAAAWASLYFYAFQNQRTGAFLLFLGVLMIALSAAGDATRSMERKIDAIVRRLEEKEIV
jgi:hypothetical protein